METGEKKTKSNPFPQVSNVSRTHSSSHSTDEFRLWCIIKEKAFSIIGRLFEKMQGCKAPKPPSMLTFQGLNILTIHMCISFALMNYLGCLSESME
jgi:hypothetical protein